VKDALMETAVDLGTPGPDNDYGAGRVDVYAAVLQAAIPNFQLEMGTAAVEVCAPDDAVVEIIIDQIQGYEEPVTLSATGVPAGASAVFSQNPVVPPATPTLTITGTENAAPGEYDILVTGTSIDFTRDDSFDLTINDMMAAAPNLTSPADGAIDVARIPTFSWQASAQANEYELQVATSPDFGGSIVYETIVNGTSHQSQIMLDSITEHFWRVRSLNACGTSDWSDVYSFTTIEQPDYFTEVFGDDFDLADHTARFVPDGGGSFYSECIEEATELPTDPAGGTNLPLSDDDSEPVNPGTPVELYGVSYDTIYVGSNGFITFTGGDSDYTESLEEHFEQPRVSALWDDLNPASGGTVSYKVLEDRIAVTWLGVPEYFNTGSNTFQVELFFNGEIHITWTDITAGGGIVVGLSAGNGVPPDFLMGDHSASGPCVAPCLGDLSGDDAVNVIDLLQLLDAWGNPGGDEDLNDDGIVNVLDLLLLLDAWGACG
jgi:hypothetical protein